MAKEQKKQENQKATTDKSAEAKAIAKQKFMQQEENEEILVRIYGYDIPSSKKIFVGLTRIKGVSWSISKALCTILKIPLTKRISELSKPEIQHIENTLDNLPIPDYLKNRRFDIETGKSEHLYSSDLDMKRDFDIKRLREIKSYKGVRHALKLPVRGQRTRSHFRKKSQASLMAKRSAK
jgi:small subunit ribosomal protein S13